MFVLLNAHIFLSVHITRDMNLKIDSIISITRHFMAYVTDIRHHIQQNHIIVISNKIWDYIVFTAFKCQTHHVIYMTQ